MSILIKGMKMPVDCLNCEFCNTGFVEPYCRLLMRKMQIGERREDCPLIPVPPHGRLIDADEFLKRAIGTKCFHGDYALMLEELVGESTTIIPTEPCKERGE